MNHIRDDNQNGYISLIDIINIIIKRKWIFLVILIISSSSILFYIRKEPILYKYYQTFKSPSQKVIVESKVALQMRERLKKQPLLDLKTIINSDEQIKLMFVTTELESIRIKKNINQIINDLQKQYLGMINNLKKQNQLLIKKEQEQLKIYRQCIDLNIKKIDGNKKLINALKKQVEMIESSVETDNKENLFFVSNKEIYLTQMSNLLLDNKLLILSNADNENNIVTNEKQISYLSSLNSSYRNMAVLSDLQRNKNPVSFILKNIILLSFSPLVSLFFVFIYELSMSNKKDRE